MEDPNLAGWNTEDPSLAHLERRLDGVERACARSRFVILMAAIISASLVVVAYNGAFSMTRAYLVHAPQAERKEVRYKTLYKEWAESESYSSSLLGIRLMASDALPFGSLALAIASTWMLFCARRENYAIRSTIRNAVTLGRAMPSASWRRAELLGYVYDRLLESMIFAWPSEHDAPAVSVDSEPKRVVYRLPRLLARALPWMPAAGLLTVAALGVGSNFVTNSEGVNGWKWLAMVHGTVQYAIQSAVFAVALPISIVNCVRARRYWNAVEGLMLEFREFLSQTEPRDGQPQAQLSYADLKRMESGYAELRQQKLADSSLPTPCSQDGET